jgi:hypothetical protein
MKPHCFANTGAPVSTGTPMLKLSLICLDYFMAAAAKSRSS